MFKHTTLAYLFAHGDNYRWHGFFDAKYRRVPVSRTFGGYMPSRVRADDMDTSIKNDFREVRRTVTHISLVTPQDYA